MIRRFPSRRELRAVEFGADELAARIEWTLRNRSRALRCARLRYRKFCADTLRRLEQTGLAGSSRVAA